MRNELDEIQTNAILLAEMLEGIDLMNNEGPTFDNARIATTIVALQWAKRLSDDLDKIENVQVRDVAAA